MVMRSVGVLSSSGTAGSSSAEFSVSSGVSSSASSCVSSVSGRVSSSVVGSFWAVSFAVHEAWAYSFPALRQVPARLLSASCPQLVQPDGPA